MKKIIQDKTICFYDENDFEIMYMDHSIDECIWFFNTDNIIKITQDMDLYDLLDNFMKQNYVFPDTILKNYKDSNKLIWYSDCYYNPDDEWSIDSVSCLHIERKNNYFNVWCTKKLDEKIERTNKSYCIAFSPCGNGIYNKNITSGYTLQDDFVHYIYQQLLLKVKSKVLKKSNKN